YDRKIEPGMIMSIEPGIYIPKLGGFRHSDTVLITDGGNVSLTKAPETLDELTIFID
ncbi:MAG: M24 family metallopeptidase, partial [Promethearchaeota archaeon]